MAVSLRYNLIPKTTKKTTDRSHELELGGWVAEVPGDHPFKVDQLLVGTVVQPPAAVGVTHHMDRKRCMPALFTCRRVVKGG